MSHFERILQNIVKGDKNRDLNHHRETSTQRVNSPPLVQQHDFLLEPCLVVLVRLSQPVHLRLDLLHFLHRFETNLGQREKDDLDQDTEDNDVNSEVLCHTMGKV